MTTTKPTIGNLDLNRCHHHGKSSKLKWQHGIAVQLSQLFNNTVSSDQICSSIGSPKYAKHGQFALPLHRIQHLLTSEPWCSQTTTETAQWIIAKISPSDYIEETSAVGSFVNFVIPKSKYMEVILQQIIEDRYQYGFNTPFIGTDNNARSSDDSSPLVVIYSDLPMVPLLLDPNHFRGLVLATFLQRSCRIQGQEVQLVNTLNTWNAEFGYLALAVSKYGLPSSSQLDSLIRINQIYLQTKQDALKDKNLEKEAQNYILRLEQGDDEMTKLWQQLQVEMIEQYQLLFDKRLSIEFDCRICTHPGEDLDAIYSLLEKCDGLIKTKDKEWKMDLESIGLGTPLIRDSKGISTQLTRDMAQIVKQERIMEVDGRGVIEYHIAGHHLTRHIQQAHHIISIMKLCSGQQLRKQRIHVDFGKVKCDTSVTTTTNHPSRFYLIECLDSLQQTMLDIMEENEGTEKYDAMMAQLGQLPVTTWTKRMDDLDDGSNSTSTIPILQLAGQHADRLGLCTMIIHQLTQRRNKPMPFSSSSPPEVFGNSGVFLQYVHSRLCGIEQQLVKRGILSFADDNKNQINPPTRNARDMGKLLSQQEAFDLAEWMTQFPRIMQQAFATTDPSSLVSYLFKLARMTNQSLYGLRIKDVQEDLALARWTLFWAARQTLANGLVALGIKPVYRM